MRTNIFILIGVVAILFATLSCKKDDQGNGTKAVFSYIADGYLVNFTNFSTNAAEHTWDFGDQSEPSTKANPLHVYRAKGDYLVTLTIKNGELTSSFTDTVVVIGPNIKIDGNFSDWDYVEYTHHNPSGEGGTLLSVKTFASAGHLNFYLEGTSDFNMAVFDLYLDTDNNPETGLKSWMYPVASGADFLLEGSFDPTTPANSSGSVFRHSGANNGWGWDDINTFAAAVSSSKMVTEGGKKAIEFSIKRDALSTMRNTINFALVEMNSGWTEVGTLPVSQKPDSKFAPFPL